ncbi:MAG TPA: aspartate aminotransferase family protein [Gammaproteobacteria bacterium]|uniref:Aminotransferase class III-fold pyridoxal phosphate-dependent enzyme n=1 Tax=OM182 bacterium TaxID=2510334 RepID=A0A520S1F5_9GAMM|nr:MAG: aminotransferase class III-fold pyridoxal phosphate-dependent enzyme [OM182 bacterium]HAO88684.1 aspartate aminotransferase family protein [Gammaproteobacteria bacterium]HAR90227.1 aspartate aminotransferase family protein [Gammaproteobacteria bacterium]HAU23328.1 aspartate aminotransferase family protein [Gammaproteobacteria bacterium]
MTSLLYPTTNLTQVEQLNIVRGEGIYVYDDKGNRYLEGLSALWCAALGYGNDELIDAITTQLRTLPYSHMFGGRTHPLAMKLADTLGEMVPVPDAKIFFANSGSEANDSHVKMLHYYFNVTGQPKKKKIIALERSYHGVTVAAAALTGLPVMHTHFDIPVDALGILRASTPHYYHGQQDGESEAGFVERLVQELEQLIEKEGAETIAAFIAEPIGGAAGVVVAPDSYYPAVQNVLRKHDILFWADEVICGFGRTGNDFGSTTMGIKPELMSLAKQLSAAYIPVSAAIIPGFMYEAMREPSNQLGIFGHGYTYTGHPVAAAAALKAIEIYQRENLFEHAAKMGDYMQSRLQEFAEHPLVGEVRGKGLIAAVELVANKERREGFADGKVGAMTKQFCQDQGLLIRAVSGNCLAFCPPLIINDEQIDEMIFMFEAALKQTLDYVHKHNLMT